MSKEKRIKPAYFVPYKGEWTNALAEAAVQQLTAWYKGKIDMKVSYGALPNGDTLITIQPQEGQHLVFRYLRANVFRFINHPRLYVEYSGSPLYYEPHLLIDYATLHEDGTLYLSCVGERDIQDIFIQLSTDNLLQLTGTVSDADELQNTKKGVFTMEVHLRVWGGLGQWSTMPMFFDCIDQAVTRLQDFREDGVPTYDGFELETENGRIYYNGSYEHYNLEGYYVLDAEAKHEVEAMSEAEAVQLLKNIDAKYSEEV